ncbi:carbohydrate kinase family protein [Angustibacter sp. McL0619]|uniref:carbohydrate kinase family protein n=1 Tax=Angustibacter sp. McL0619 TaxID=3415676 RepID=UPI003CFA6B99
MAALEPAVSTPLLVVGESLVDVVVRPSQDDVHRYVGGSPANVAMGLARLGHSVQFATRLGDDPDGALVRTALESDGVRLAYGWQSRSRTSTATATLDAGGSASYVFDLVWDLPPLDVSAAEHVHTGSIAAALGPGAAAVQVAVSAAHALGATTSYDPNLRPQIIGTADAERPGVEALVASSDVVKASEEDLEWLYGPGSTQRVAAHWATTGPALVVVTRGGEGALAWRGAGSAEPMTVAPQPVQVVDTVGAGDSFMSGLLSGLADQGVLGRGCRSALDAAGDDVVRAALDRATRTSSITCGRAGSNPPHRAELG